MILGADRAPERRYSAPVPRSVLCNVEESSVGCSDLHLRDYGLGSSWEYLD